jgi:hypothetical protein
MTGKAPSTPRLRLSRTKIYELAKDLAEARGLRDAGFGYETRKEAMEARANPEIDPYYRQTCLKVFELEIANET